MLMSFKFLKDFIDIAEKNLIKMVDIMTPLLVELGNGMRSIMDFVLKFSDVFTYFRKEFGTMDTSGDIKFGDILGAAFNPTESENKAQRAAIAGGMLTGMKVGAVAGPKGMILGTGIGATTGFGGTVLAQAKFRAMERAQEEAVGLRGRVALTPGRDGKVVYPDRGSSFDPAALAETLKKSIKEGMQESREAVQHLKITGMEKAVIQSANKSRK